MEMTLLFNRWRCILVFACAAMTFLFCHSPVYGRDKPRPKTGQLRLVGEDTDAVPLVRVNPRYPRDAQVRGISGWVHLEFAVTPQGATADIVVLASDPEGYFEQAAIEAVERYEYKPRMTGRRAVSRPGLQVVLSFDIVGEPGFEELYRLVERGDPKKKAVLRMQELLQQEGYDPGASDGVLGARTRRAIRDWQVATGQEPHGLATLVRGAPEEDAPLGSASAQGATRTDATATTFDSDLRRVSRTTMTLTPPFASTSAEFSYDGGTEIRGADGEAVSVAELRSIVEAAQKAGLTGVPVTVKLSLKSAQASQVSELRVKTTKASVVAEALHLSARQGDVKAVQRLLDQGAPVNGASTDGVTAIYFAMIARDDPETTRLLLERGADLTATDGEKRTPLHAAAMFGRRNSAVLLLDAGAHVNSRDVKGETPLHYAATAGAAEMVSLLLERGADASFSGADSWTALHNASRKAHTEIIRQLLGAGAEIDARASSGKTPLHLAAEGGHREAVKMLVFHGADRGAVSTDGVTPAGLAKARGHDEIAADLSAESVSVPKEDLGEGTREVTMPAGETETGRYQLSAEGDMVLVPGGAFYMGCNESVDTECHDVEKPGRTVGVPEFWIDRLEVAVADYERCVRAEQCSSDGVTMPYFKGKNQPAAAEPCNWGKSGRERHPMNCLDWYQARSYCEWVGKRLPREAEWEKAARGTDGRKYPWGNTAYGRGGPVANIADESMKRRAPNLAGTAPGYDDGYVETAPVGSFPGGASPYGAHDMIGNVAEWLQEDAGDGRGVRGGSWLYFPRNARASFHTKNGARNRDHDIGFRCAR